MAATMGRKTMMEVGRASMVGDLQKFAAFVDPSNHIKVGDKVKVGSTQLRGTIKFLGTTEFSSGEWIGVALQEPAGKNDGSVKGVRYFTCDPQYGLFVRRSNVVLDEAVNTDDKSESQDEAPGRRSSMEQWDSQDWTKVGEKFFTASENVESGTKPSIRPLAVLAPTTVSETELRKAEQDLAEAMEEHDIDRLRRTLSVAASVGVTPTELDGAVRVLNFEVQRALFREIEEARSVIAQLTESVSMAEARAQQAEAKATTSAVTALRPPSATEEPSQAWIEQVGAQLEERVWSSLQHRLETTVENAVEHATQALLVVVSEFKAACARGEDTKKKKGKARFQLSEDEAAIRLQARARGMLVRKKDPADKSPEAKFIVTWWLESSLHRMNNRLDILESRRQQVETAKRELLTTGGAAGFVTQARQDAATLKIQAMARGRAVRKSANNQRKAAATIQRQLRRFMARRYIPESTAAVAVQLSGQNLMASMGSMGTVAQKMMSRNKAWEAIFQENLKDAKESLDCVGFSTALREVHPRLTSSQALVLWKGFLSGADAQDVDWEAFYAIAEAVAIDDHCAAEFADISVEAFRQLGVTGGDAAATRLQAAHRGFVARQEVANRRQLVKSSGTGVRQNAHPSALDRAKAAERVQALERARQMRQQKLKQEQAATLKKSVSEQKRSDAARLLQRAFRTLQATKTTQGTSFSFGMVASMVRRRHNAWTGIFDEVSGGQGILDRSSFAAGLNEVHPRYSPMQARALWEGFVAGTDLGGVDVSGFCCILEAGAIGEDYLAEFADMCTQDFAALRFANSSAASGDQGTLDEAGWRKLRPDFAGMFDQARGRSPTLDDTAFAKAIGIACPRLTKGQVNALWSGYCKGTGRDKWIMEDFCACAEAVELGDHAAAEFADIASEHFTLLGAEGGESAATKLQAAQRGKVARRTISADRNVIPNGDAHACRVYSPEQARAAERIQALERGRAVRAGVASKAAKREFTDEEVQAAIKMQGLYRIYSARRRCASLDTKGDRASVFYKAATVIKAKHKAWVELFDAAIAGQNGSCTNLQEPAFTATLTKVHPRLSAAQVEALWSGVIEGLGREDVDVKTWCHLCQAVAVGDERAAEFADLAFEDFVALGPPKQKR